MTFWGATFTQVVEELQGADVNNTLDAGDYGGQAKIEEVMAQEMEVIKSNIPLNSVTVINSGKIECHKVIDNVQNVSQTAVDPNQGFIGIVDVDTFRIGKNSELTNTQDGLDLADWSISGNVLSVSASKVRGDTFYAYYTVDPSTMILSGLARLLIKMSAMVLMRREVIGGSGDDGGISDTADIMAVEIGESLQAIRDTTSIARLLQMNLCEPVTGPDTAKSVNVSRCS